jgi:hypothetical protein
MYLRAVNEYYPFGMLQPDHIWSSENYRYGFNGKEKDDEVREASVAEGLGNSYYFGARMYDPRVGRKNNSKNIIFFEFFLVFCIFSLLICFLFNKYNLCRK